jgi:hypothetical protein
MEGRRGSDRETKLVSGKVSTLNRPVGSPQTGSRRTLDRLPTSRCSAGPIAEAGTPGTITAWLTNGCWRVSYVPSARAETRATAAVFSAHAQRPAAANGCFDGHSTVAVAARGQAGAGTTTLDSQKQTPAARHTRGCRFDAASTGLGAADQDSSPETGGVRAPRPSGDRCKHCLRPGPGEADPTPADRGKEDKQRDTPPDDVGSGCCGASRSDHNQVGESEKDSAGPQHNPSAVRHWGLGDVPADQDQAGSTPTPSGDRQERCREDHRRVGRDYPVILARGPFTLQRLRGGHS